MGTIHEINDWWKREIKVFDRRSDTTYSKWSILEKMAIWKFPCHCMAHQFYGADDWETSSFFTNSQWCLGGCARLLSWFGEFVSNLIWRPNFGNPNRVNMTLLPITMRWWLYGKNWTSVMIMLGKIPMIVLLIRREKRMIESTCSSLVLIEIWMKLEDGFWAEIHCPPFMKFSLTLGMRSPRWELCCKI